MQIKLVCKWFYNWIELFMGSRIKDARVHFSLQQNNKTKNGITSCLWFYVKFSGIQKYKPFRYAANMNFS